MTTTNESERKPDLQENTEIARWCALSFIAGLVVAALALEYYGYIKHPKASDAAIIDELKLLSLKPEFEVKVSEKKSGKEVFCINGYLLLRPTNGKSVAGIVVDDKNRGIQCDLVEPASSESYEDKPSEIDSAEVESAEVKSIDQ